MKKRILLSSFATIMLCLCLIAGSTYSLFTQRTTVNVAVTAGKVDVTATIDETNMSGTSLGDPATKDANGVIHFTNGGTATLNGAELVIAMLTPGDFVDVPIQGTDNSNIAIKYRYEVKVTERSNLVSALTVKVDGEKCTLSSGDTYFVSQWFTPDSETGIGDVTISVGMDASVGNTDANGNSYHDQEAKISVVLVAVQANGVDANGNLIEP